MQNKIWIYLMIVFLIQIKTIVMEPTWYETKYGKRFLIDTAKKVKGTYYFKTTS